MPPPNREARRLQRLARGLFEASIAGRIGPDIKRRVKSTVKRILFPFLVSAALWAAGVAGLIVFGTAKPPPPASAITRPFSGIVEPTLPELRRYRARDGAWLSFREYPAPDRQAAVLIHGSAGSGRDMDALARALQGAGVTVLVPDLRGHGSNRPHGDITYVGQLDDDLADFIAKEKPNFPNAVWTAVGFSSGGAFVLRVAAGHSRVALPAI